MFLIFLKISPKLRLDVLINHVLIKKKVCIIVITLLRTIDSFLMISEEVVRERQLVGINVMILNI